MKTNLRPIPEMEENPQIIAEIEEEVVSAKREYTERLWRIQRDRKESLIFRGV